jgi:competence protein ComGC
MELGRYADGRALSYDEGTGTFAVGQAPVSAEDVRRYAGAGQITWASPDTAAWFHRSFPPTRKKGGAGIAIMIVGICFVLLFVCGIFAAIAIPTFSAARDKAQAKSCYANERLIEGAAQSYKAESGALPDSVEALSPVYIKMTPACPTGGSYSWDSAAGTVTCSEHGHY